MKTEVKEIPFNEGTLLGVRTEDGNVWLAVRTACRDIGLSEKQAENEVKKVKDSLLFENQWTELTLKFRGQVRKITVLSEKFVPMWLAQINLTPNMRKKQSRSSRTIIKVSTRSS